MLTAVFPLLGFVLLAISLVASVVGSLLLTRAGRLRQASRAAVPAGRADVLGVLGLSASAVLAACGAAALSNGTLTLAGCWPFLVALTAVCLPVLAAGAARHRHR